MTLPDCLVTYVAPWRASGNPIASWPRIRIAVGVRHARDELADATFANLQRRSPLLSDGDSSTPRVPICRHQPGKHAVFERPPSPNSRMPFVLPCRQAETPAAPPVLRCLAGLRRAYSDMISHHLGIW